MHEEISNLMSEHSPLSRAAYESLSESQKRALSVRLLFSKPSQVAETNRALGTLIDELEYQIIGLGSCGTIFEIPKTDLTIKKGGDTQTTWTDFLLTNKVYNAMLNTRNVLQDAFYPTTLPQSVRCSQSLLPSDSEACWDANLKCFPRSHRARSAAFQMDRIRPFSQTIREALIELYFDDSNRIQEKIKNNVDNEDCLIRIYVGKMRH